MFEGGLNRKLIIGIFAGAIILLLLILIVAGSGDKKPKVAPKKEDITLTYWRAFDDQSAFDELIKEYEREHSNVKIEYKKIGIQDYEKKMVDALAAGKGPDLFAVHNDWMPKFFDKVTPIGEDQLSLDEYKKTFYPVATQDNVKDNRIYGIPYSIDTLALYYNPTLIAQAGADVPVYWEDLTGVPNQKEGILGKLTVREGNRIKQSAIALGNNGVNRSVDIVAMMMLQNHADMVSQDQDKALFNLPKQVEGRGDVHVGTEALKLYSAFADPRTSYYSWSAEQGDSVKAFADGRTAMMINYSYQIPNIKRFNPSLNFRIAKAPQVPGQDPVNYASYWTEVVSKDSKHAKEAWEFIKFVSSRQKVMQYNNNVNNPPARNDVPAPGGLNDFNEQAASATSWFKGDYLKADAVFREMIDLILKGEDPQRVMDLGANKQTDLLKSFGGLSQ